MSSLKEPSIQSPDSAFDQELESQKLHRLLLQISRDEDAKVEERQAAIAKNRARAMRLLAVLENSQG